MDKPSSTQLSLVPNNAGVLRLVHNVRVFRRGQTALISVARWGKGRPQPELVKILIQTGVDVNALDDLVGDTALISLARWGEGRQISPEVVKILIQAGVDVNVLDNYGHDALFYAAKASNAAVIKALLQPEVAQKVKTKGSTAQ